MKKKLLLVLVSIFFFQPTYAQVFWTDLFEDAGSPSAGSRIIPTGVSSDGTECAVGDYHIRIDYLGGSDPMYNGGGMNGIFTGKQGDKYWRTEDVDGSCPSNASLTMNPAAIEYDNISIANLDGVELIISLAGRTSTAFEANTYLRIQYDINNSGSYTNGFCLVGEASPSVGFFIDADCNLAADGSTTITEAFGDFSFDVTAATGPGDVLDLRIETNIGAGEEIGIDNIRLNETTIAPVELSYFSVKLQEGAAALIWQTASEENNNYFQIEHSTDGRYFTAIDKVNGIGTSAEINNYTYLHKTPKSGLNYYRLKQVDYDGAFEYSKIVSLVSGTDKVSYTVYPNPFEDEVTIEFPLSDDSYSGLATRNIKVYDLFGRLVQSIQVPMDESKIKLDLLQLLSGTYFVEIEVGNKLMITQRLIKID